MQTQAVHEGRAAMRTARRNHCVGTLCCAAVLALVLPGSVRADTGLDADADAEQQLERLGQLSLEELMQVPVTSVAGTRQTRFSTPAAISVITAEDIRRAGHRHVAEALRMVPGMFVGRINSSSWVVGARGLTGSALTSTRYLVLIDGRSVHDPLISSTFWDTVDLVIEDIDRIEVIRGPGATLWGVNAMNGVINIITRSSHETHGTMIKAGYGSAEPGNVSLRYGAAIDGDTSWRVWAKYFARDDFDGPGGASLQDQWSTLRGGFRVDGKLDGGADYVVQGEAYTHPTAMSSVRLPVPGQDRQFVQATGNDTVDGANVMFRTFRGFGEDNGWRLRVYLDHTRRDTPRFGVRRDTLDLDYRRWRQWTPSNELVWGLQFNRTRDDVDNGPVLLFDPARRSWSTFNAFVQNTTDFAQDRWHVMVGSKFTEHSFAGFQVQPSARAWFTPDDRSTWWAAVSRPVRVPSRFEEDGLLVFSYVDLGAITTGTPNGVIVPVGVSGDESLRPERLLAWELGYRVRLGQRWVVDTALFHNDYERLIGAQPGILGPFTDAGRGRTSGFDVSVSGQLTDRWRMEGSYSRLDTRVDGPIYDFEEDSTPRNMAQLRSTLELSPTLEFDAGVYSVDRIPRLAIDPYTRLDLGLVWTSSPGVRWSLWGQNLLEDGHAEASGAMVPRSVYAQVVYELGQ
jgi:iron complex outermembrane receptor protein